MAWLPGYSKRKEITITGGSSGAQTNFQLKLDITHDSDMQSDFDDLRFTQSDGQTLVDAWLETKINDTSAMVWVEFPTTPADTVEQTYYMYYGKGDAESDWHIEATMLFGDDFAGFELIPEPTNPTRAPDDPWEGGEVNEFSNFNYGGEYISWYRGNNSGTYETGYETSADGITWVPYANNPILTTPTVYNYVVQDGDNFYLFVNTDSTANGNGDMYLYNVTDHTNPVIMNNGNPVYTRSTTTTDWDYKIFNPGITIDGSGRWHMLLEGKTSTGNFQTGYAYSDLVEMDWSAHRSSAPVLSGVTGNPDLVYVPDKNALLSVHGTRTGTYWEIHASYMNLLDDPSLAASWHLSDRFDISVGGVHIADPCLMTNFSTQYPLMLSYNYNQASIYQEYCVKSLNEFYDIIITPVNLTGKWASNNMSLYDHVDDTLKMVVAAPNDIINSKNSYNNYVVESRQKSVGSLPCQSHVTMSNIQATDSIKERTSVRIGDSFVSYIDGVYSTAGTGVSNTWYRSKITVPSTGNATAAIFSDAGGELVSKTGTPAYRTAYLGIYQTGANTGYIDWVFIRKYAENPPTYAFGGEQSSGGWTGKIIGITNPAKVFGIAVANISKIMEV